MAGLVPLRLAQESESLPLTAFLRRAKLAWHGPRLHQPDWSNESHTLAYTVEDSDGTHRYHFIFNAFLPNGPVQARRNFCNISP